MVQSKQNKQKINQDPSAAMFNNIFPFATIVANECYYSPHLYPIINIYSFYIF